jgi:hypothetical protein
LDPTTSLIIELVGPAASPFISHIPCNKLLSSSQPILFRTYSVRKFCKRPEAGLSTFFLRHKTFVQLDDGICAERDGYTPFVYVFLRAVKGKGIYQDCRAKASSSTTGADYFMCMRTRVCLDDDYDFSSSQRFPLTPLAFPAEGFLAPLLFSTQSFARWRRLGGACLSVGFVYHWFLFPRLC